MRSAILHTLPLLLLGAPLGQAQPLSASPELLYPTNPPRPLSRPATFSPSLLGEFFGPKISETHLKDEAEGNRLLEMTVTGGTNFGGMTLPDNAEIRVYFFEKTTEGKIVPRSFEVAELVSVDPDQENPQTPSWIFQARYSPDRATPDRVFGGYLVGLYKHGKLLHSQASSSSLREECPLAASIPTSAFPAIHQKAESTLEEILTLRKDARQQIRENNTALARQCLVNAQRLLVGLKKDYPGWQSTIVSYLERTTKEMLSDF